MEFFKLLWRIISEFFLVHTNRAEEAWENGDCISVIVNMGIVIISAIAGIVIPVILSYRFRRLIMAIAIPIIILALLIASFYENYKKPAPSTPLLSSPPDIEETSANAARTYRPMAQSAFLLFAELCRYFPGLVKPFSLASVEAPVHFDITASLITLYHFSIGKGENDAPVSAITEVLETIINQHLQAQDIPISVPATYTSIDGSTWPGMVVDGVYDLGKTYRIDFAITSEAMVSRFRNRVVSGYDSSISDRRINQDEDFD